MIGYVLSAGMLIYFFLIWPNYDNLPPQTKRTRRQRIAGRLGLHDKPSFGRIFLTSTQKEELLNYVIYTDRNTYNKITKSNCFFLVEERKSMLSIYCPIGAIKCPDTYEMLLNRKLFTKLNIEEKPLKNFLREVQPLRKVKQDA